MQIFPVVCTAFGYFAHPKLLLPAPAVANLERPILRGAHFLVDTAVHGYLRNPRDISEFVRSDTRCRTTKIRLVLFLCFMFNNILPSVGLCRYVCIYIYIYMYVDMYVDLLPTFF
jgi:hypothetical protein